MLTPKDIQILNLKGYLNSTDWYVIRKLEKGIEIPAEITTAREAARQRINELENT